MAQPVDVVGLLENRRLSRYVLIMMIVALLAQIFEGFDFVNLAYIAPVLVKQWGVDRAAMGPVFSASLAGLVAGALIFGTLGDRIGRKPTVIISVLSFGICSLATVAATNLNQLLVLRLITGIGIGGVMPTTMALAAEYAPRHLRASLTTIMSCGLTLGGVLGGLVAQGLVPSYGWTAVFWVGGLGPLLVLPLLIVFLPESIRYLVLRRLDDPKHDARVAAILHRIDPALEFAAGTHFTLREDVIQRGRFRDLFAAGWAVPTVLLWLTVFMNIVMSTFYNQWTPIMLTSFGLALGAAQTAAILFQVGSIIGAFVLGALADRIGFFWVLAVSYALSAACSALAVSFGPVPAYVQLFVFLFGMSGGAAQNCVNGLSGTFYPTAIRATGSGWALAVGRCGGVVGPMLGGMLLAARWSIPDIFYIVMIPSLIASSSILMMGVAAMRSGVAPLPARLRA